jgi:hypothetical protein
MQEDMFDRIHEALDVEPPAGAYERLRVALSRKPVRVRRWPALETRWSKMGFKIAAGVALAALAVGIVAAVFALHSAQNNQVPSGKGMSIPAYQKMIADDNAAASASWSSPCDTTVYTGCLADANRAIPVVQKWLDDLNRSATPARFAVVDAEMRAHLAQNITALHALAAASQAGDLSSVYRTFVVALYAAEWTGTVVPGITGSQQVDAVAYVESIRSWKHSFGACATCTLIFSTDSSTCVTNGGVPCLQLFDQTAVQFADFEGAVIQKAAPASLAAKDARLQRDLKQADNVLLTMRLAVSANDQVGINAGFPELRRISQLTDQDANSIVQG